MKSVLGHIKENTVFFSQRPFFHYLSDESLTVGDRLCFAPSMAHFVFSFMDINRFILPDIADNNEYQKLINIHAAEDAWHWPWYLHDLLAMQMDPSLRFSDSLRFLWGDATSLSRQLSYQCIALLGNATPVQKIAVVETIEMTGKVFLEHTAQLCAQWRAAPAEMLYFGQSHADCETGHHMGTKGVMSYLEGIVLSHPEQIACCEMVDTLFELYGQFVDEMLAFAQHVKKLDVATVYRHGALLDDRRRDKQ